MLNDLYIHFKRLIGPLIRGANKDEDDFFSDNPFLIF